VRKYQWEKERLEEKIEVVEREREREGGGRRGREESADEGRIPLYHGIQIPVGTSRHVIQLQAKRRNADGR